MAEPGSPILPRAERNRRRVLERQESLRDVERAKFLQLIQPDDSDRVFDVGCSTGKLLDLLKNKYGVAEAHGSDVDPLLAKPDAGIIVASGEQLMGVPDEHYTKVIFSHSLEHIPNRGAALEEAYRILHDDGRLYVTFFLYTEESRAMPGIAGCFDSPAPIVAPEQIVAEIERAGFQILSQEVVTKLTSLNLEIAAVPSLMIEAEKIPMATSY